MIEGFEYPGVPLASMPIPAKQRKPSESAIGLAYANPGVGLSYSPAPGINL